jgi:hypothetical protein
MTSPSKEHLYAYYDGENVKNFEQIDSISVYNRNYYHGIGNDLLFSKSDDDMTTEWFVVRGDYNPVYIGYSLVGVSPQERLVFSTERGT